MKTSFSSLFPFVLGFLLMGCPAEPPSEVEEEAAPTSSPSSEVDPRIVAVGLPIPEGANLVDGFSKMDDVRTVVVLESSASEDVLVQFYRAKLNKIPTPRRFSDRTEYVWRWTEGEHAKEVHVRPVEEALKGEHFQKDTRMSITLVSRPAGP